MKMFAKMTKVSSTLSRCFFLFIVFVCLRFCSYFEHILNQSVSFSFNIILYFVFQGGFQYFTLPVGANGTVAAIVTVFSGTPTVYLSTTDTMPNSTSSTNTFI